MLTVDLDHLQLFQNPSKLVLSSIILDTKVDRVTNDDLPLCSVLDLSRQLSDRQASPHLDVASKQGSRNYRSLGVKQICQNNFSNAVIQQISRKVRKVLQNRQVISTVTYPNPFSSLTG